RRASMPPGDGFGEEVVEMIMESPYCQQEARADASTFAPRAGGGKSDDVIHAAEAVGCPPKAPAAPLVQSCQPVLNACVASTGTRERASPQHRRSPAPVRGRLRGHACIRLPRSEERRVGKDCGTRPSAYRP